MGQLATVGLARKPGERINLAEPLIVGALTGADVLLRGVEGGFNAAIKGVGQIIQELGGSTTSARRTERSLNAWLFTLAVTTGGVPIVSSTVRMCLRMRPMNFMNGLTARAAIRNGAPMPAA